MPLVDVASLLYYAVPSGSVVSTAERKYTFRYFDNISDLTLF